MPLSTFEIGATAASLRNGVEITVNVIICEQKPIRYGFREGAKIILYSVNTASVYHV